VDVVCVGIAAICLVYSLGGAMKYLFGLIALTWLGAMWAAVEAVGHKPSQIPRAQIEARNLAVVLVKSGHGYCTGFFIRAGIIVTAKHCVGPSPKVGNHIDVEMIDGVRITTLLIGFGEDKDYDDFALLKDPFYHTDSLHNYKDKAYDYTLCAHIRYDNSANTEYLVPGIIDSTLPDGRIMIHSIVNPGDSGGPLMDFMGSVIGVIVSTDQYDLIGDAVPIATVINKLNSIDR